MKYTEIQAFSLIELNEKIATEKEKLRKLKFAHVISPIENPMKFKNSRKTIAQLKTAQVALKNNNK
jgi:large subunit ribosomal protein L29